MAGLGISFHILALYVSLLTHQIQGSRLLPINPEVSVLCHIQFCSSLFPQILLLLCNFGVISIQMWKGQHLPSEAGKDKPYVSSFDFYLRIRLTSELVRPRSHDWQVQYSLHVLQFAVHKTNTGSYFGMVATMDVYGYSLTGGQASVAAIWIGNELWDAK